MQKTLKMALGLAFLMLSGCASVHLSMINTRDTAVNNVQYKVGENLTNLASLAPGAVVESSWSGKKAAEISLSFTDAQGHQYFCSSPVSLKPGDGGWVQLSITAAGTLAAVDGRKK
jgi:hypothetical protein